jgi:hypothetical protein
MKRYLLLLSALYTLGLQLQVTVLIIKSNFGFDGELRTNFFSTIALAGNDDWFTQGNLGSGLHVIDTVGSASIRNRYAIDLGFRKRTLQVGMRYPQFSSLNNSLWLDALFIRDHHGDDSTVFAQGSNKNGMSPQNWQSPVSQGIPDKNDILDFYSHIRREGASGSDSLWFFGGVVIENTTGSRYFDVEMYQTDIYFDRGTLSFKNYGPDAGHTSWTFDAMGNILTTGDIIFTAEFNNTGISVLQARIWIDKNDLNVTPTAFDWGGAFDGDGNSAQFGYANILPKVAGNFYTGLQSLVNAWSGSYGLIRQDDTYTSSFEAKQFMEFSVNLSKLGLDPLANGQDVCTMPFRKVLVKSRSSASFTAELKDFVGPFYILNAPKAAASADIPFYCGVIGVSTISVTNAIPTSVYEWTTTDGQILTDPRLPSITVNRPGTYIVMQRLQDQCLDVYARDTVVITFDPFCSVLPLTLHRFEGKVNLKDADLRWEISQASQVRSIIVERGSQETGTFEGVYTQDTKWTDARQVFTWVDAGAFQHKQQRYYRLRITDMNGGIRYSRVIDLRTKLEPLSEVKWVQVHQKPFIQLVNQKSVLGKFEILDASGRMIKHWNQWLPVGTLQIPIETVSQSKQLYLIRVTMDSVQTTLKAIW